MGIRKVGFSQTRRLCHWRAVAAVARTAKKVELPGMVGPLCWGTLMNQNNPICARSLHFFRVHVRANAVFSHKSN